MSIEIQLSFAEREMFLPDLSIESARWLAEEQRVMVIAGHHGRDDERDGTCGRASSFDFMSPVLAVPGSCSKSGARRVLHEPDERASPTVWRMCTHDHCASMRTQFEHTAMRPARWRWPGGKSHTVLFLP